MTKSKTGRASSRTDEFYETLNATQPQLGIWTRPQSLEPDLSGKATAIITLILTVAAALALTFLFITALAAIKATTSQSSLLSISR